MTIEFVLIGLIASACFGVSIVVKKHIFSGTTIPDYVFTLLASGIQFAVGIPLVILYDISLFDEQRIIGILIFAGFIYGVSLILYYYAINHDDASRVSQLASLEAVITPLFALVLIGESPSLQALAGAGLIVIALLILTLEKDVLGMITTAKFAVIPIGLALVIWGVEDVLIKYTLDYVDFIFAYFWLRFSGFLSLGILFGARNQTRNQVRRLYTDFPPRKLAVFTIGSLVSSTGLVLTLKTYSLGPLAIASPLVASYPLFVLLFVYILYQVFGYELEEPGSLPKRVLSGLLFLGGIALLAI